MNLNRTTYQPCFVDNRHTFMYAVGAIAIQQRIGGWVFAYDVSNPIAPKKLDVLLQHIHS